MASYKPFVIKRKNKQDNLTLGIDDETENFESRIRFIQGANLFVVVFI